MSMRTGTARGIAGASVILVAVGLLSGCASEEVSPRAEATPTSAAHPTPSPTSTPTSTPRASAGPEAPAVDGESGVDADPDVAPAAPSSAVVVGADRVLIRDPQGTTRATAMFSAPSEVVALLTAELGAPHSSTHDTRCGYDIVRWERLVGGPLDVWAQSARLLGVPRPSST